MAAVMATQAMEWPAAPIWSSSRRVLVVDDDRDIRELLVELLGGEGYLVSSAADGRQALWEAHAHRPDVILLDLMMPVMDGYQFRAAQLDDPDLARGPGRDHLGLRPHGSKRQRSSRSPSWWRSSSPRSTAWRL